MKDHTNQPDSAKTDPFEGESHGADRVREAFGGSGGLDPAFRQRLLQGAAPAMEANRSRRASKPFVRRVAPWAAAAALLLTVSVVVLTQQQTTPTSDQLVASMAESVDPMDANRDGVVDILDAHALAVAADANGADQIATRVVRLDRAGSAAGSGGNG